MSTSSRDRAYCEGYEVGLARGAAQARAELLPLLIAAHPVVAAQAERIEREARRHRHPCVKDIRAAIQAIAAETWALAEKIATVAATHQPRTPRKPDLKVMLQDLKVRPPRLR